MYTTGKQIAMNMLKSCLVNVIPKQFFVLYNFSFLQVFFEYFIFPLNISFSIKQKENTTFFYLFYYGSNEFQNFIIISYCFCIF